MVWAIFRSINPVCSSMPMYDKTVNNHPTKNRSTTPHLDLLGSSSTIPTTAGETCHVQHHSADFQAARPPLPQGRPEKLPRSLLGRYRPETLLAKLLDSSLPPANHLISEVKAMVNSDHCHHSVGWLSMSDHGRCSKCRAISCHSLDESQDESVYDTPYHQSGTPEGVLVWRFM